MKRNIEKCTHITIKITIRGGGGTALYAAYIVDIVYTVQFTWLMVM